MTAARRGWAAALHHHWFHRLSPADWFGGSDAVDDGLRARFGRWHAALRTQPAIRFLASPRDALGAVLLFDQVPRNIFRGQAEAWATDPLALAITRAVLARGWEAGLRQEERQFLYMPLMHSEDIRDQRLSLRAFASLPRRMGWDYARAHHRMIARFGRYPHRNAILGRASTPAEEAAVAAGYAW
ncbi:DUF924 domain-containing protein [Erythrobacteraceae bacterium CFH 75059]|uniref:DUF924 family protein n=1 Tax=Qipengyuania thermophila TaxID=2509361 RepID=UPI0010218661|nr:DUF924 family protein [Qipengyuania thermophila]TCD06395.1 DUF924 domain-containing protein [Erythrobacteraceae bacterium CFH 75059]